MLYTKIKLENNELKSCKLTATFKNAKLSEILEVISNTFGITIEKTDNYFLLKGKAC